MALIIAFLLNLGIINCSNDACHQFIFDNKEFLEKEGFEIFDDIIEV